MKTCSQCHEDKPSSAFYQKGGGRKCKVCIRANVLTYRNTNLEKIQEYDRLRGQDPTRQAKNRTNYRKRISTKAGRKKEWIKSAHYREQNKLKRAVNVITGHAIRKGTLVKQPCERCGSSEAVHAHHEDYSKPLDVNWLCLACHGLRHREINEERRRKARLAQWQSACFVSSRF